LQDIHHQKICYLEAVLKVRIRKSRAGLIVSGLFLLAAIAVFCWIFFVASKNPADSGESGILLLPFAMPWVMWLPVGWLGQFTGFACIFLNALLLYLLFGGLRVSHGDQESS
jgi:uncharacterized membrane protein YhaH (DUF805 family)